MLIFDILSWFSYIHLYTYMDFSDDHVCFTEYRIWFDLISGISSDRNYICSMVLTQSVELRPRHTPLGCFCTSKPHCCHSYGLQLLQWNQHCTIYPRGELIYMYQTWRWFNWSLVFAVFTYGNAYHLELLHECYNMYIHNLTLKMKLNLLWWQQLFYGYVRNGVLDKWMTREPDMSIVTVHKYCTVDIEGEWQQPTNDTNTLMTTTHLWHQHMYDTNTLMTPTHSWHRQTNDTNPLMTQTHSWHQHTLMTQTHSWNQHTHDCNTRRTPTNEWH